MKSYTLKSFSFLLLSVFMLSSIPSFAITTTVNAGTAQYSTATTTTGHVAKQKSEKRGFFSKIKNFGKKASMFLKGLAGGEHSAIVAILIAFFIGWTGLHRVYLGGRPVLILLYIITLGGIFGLLPLIDFIRLLIGHMDHYEGNDKFFAAFS
ncbi:MAG: TM2 domain-containing protein [Phycisphaerae bacterium]|nr:TM2 domain-containing protein [Saprospiraceae bacterium]